MRGEKRVGVVVRGEKRVGEAGRVGESQRSVFLPGVRTAVKKNVMSQADGCMNISL